MKYMPILYESTEKKFTDNGLGRLTALTACTVTQGLNEDSYELSASYPVNAPLYDQIQVDRIIYVPSCKKMIRETGWPDQIPQPFRIYNTTKDLASGLITINATHAALHMMHLCVTCPGSISGTSYEIMEALVAGAITNGSEWPFTFHTYMDTETSIDFSTPVTLYDAFYDEENGILVKLGAKMLLNKYDIYLVPISDDYTGTTIMQGKNMSSLQIVADESEVITGVVPYYSTEADDGTVTTIYAEPRVVSFDDYDVAFDHLLPIDCTSDIETPDWAGDEWQPDPGDLVEWGEDYLRANYDNFVPVTYASGLVTASDIITGDIVLGDVVAVISKTLRTRTTSRVTGIVYNCLTDSYDSITLGTTRTNLAQTIVDLTSTKKKTQKVSLTARRGVSGEFTWTFNHSGQLVDTVVRNTQSNRACKTKTGSRYRSTLIYLKIPDDCSSFRGWKWEQYDCKFLSACEYTADVVLYKHTSKYVEVYIVTDKKCYVSGTIYFHYRQNSGTMEDKYYLSPVDVTFQKAQYWYADCLGKNKGAYVKKNTAYSCLGKCEDMYACIAAKSTYYLAGFAKTGTSDASVDGGQPWTSPSSVPIYRESKLKTKVGTIPANTQCDCIAVLGNAFLLVWPVAGQNYHRIGFANNSGGILLDDYTAYWDLTNDLLDTVDDYAITLHGGATQDSDGIHLTGAAQYIRIGKENNEYLYDFADKRVVIEFGDCSKEFEDSVHGRLIRLASTKGYTGNDNGLVYNHNNGTWQVYVDGAWVDNDNDVTESDAISNTTVELICKANTDGNKDGEWWFKIGDTTVMHQTGISTDYHYFAIGFSQYSYCDAIVRSIKIYPYAES